MYAAYAELQKLVLHVSISLALRSKIFSSSSYYHCYSSESPRSFPFKFLTSLRLCSKILFSSISIIIDATLWDLLWNFIKSWMLLYQLFLNIIDAMLQDLLFFFQSSVMQSFRSSVQLSNIVVSTLYDLLFKFLRSLMLGRSCLRFATMAAATLEGVLFSFLTVLRLLLPKSKIKPQYMLSLFFHVCFLFFASSDIRSSQLISPCLASSQLISCERCVAAKMRLTTYCANNNALIPLKFRKQLHVYLARRFTNLRFYGFTVNFANLPNLPFYAPKPASSDCKFTILPFYGAFLGNNGIYHFTVLPFYGAPWQKTCLKPAPCTQTPQCIG